MIQVIEQTYEEKLMLYMKLTKKDLVKMLIQANEIIDSTGTIAYSTNSSARYHHNYIQKDTYWKQCTHCNNLAPLQQQF